jgi:hypothetical protein
VTYSYTDGQFYYFMDQETFEMIPISGELIGADQLRYLKENMECEGLVHDDRVIAVELPDFVILQIDADGSGVRGDTAQGGTKPATLETGAVIQVPLFIEEGDVVKVDRREDNTWSGPDDRPGIPGTADPDPRRERDRPHRDRTRRDPHPGLQVPVRRGGLRSRCAGPPRRTRRPPPTSAPTAASSRRPRRRLRDLPPRRPMASNLAEITSPMVGTFYRAAAPGRFDPVHRRREAGSPKEIRSASSKP